MSKVRMTDDRGRMAAKAKGEKKGVAQTVREAARSLGTFTTDDLYRADCDNYFRKPQITAALRDFCKSGEVRKVQMTDDGRRTTAKDKAKPLYEYVEKHTWGFGVREKVYRAMHIKGVFTVRDLTVLSDAEHSYVCALVRNMTGAGDIVQDGKMPGPRRPEPAYRVVNRDDFFLKYVNPAKRSHSREES